MTTHQLVRWPTDQKWFDSGEGGLYAWVAFRRQESLYYECFVDVWPTLNAPDAEVSRSLLFDPPSCLAVRDAPSSEELAAVIFLGSTWRSLVSASGDGYFTVGYEDLTPWGVTLVDSLSTMYGDPIFFTGLDT